MNYFNLIRLLPPERYRQVRPWSYWVPRPLLQTLPLGKAGEVDARVVGGEAHGTLWVTANYLRLHSWPKQVKHGDVMGIEGTGSLPESEDSSVLVTRGEALELAFLLNKLPLLALLKGERLSKMHVIIGGGPMNHLASTARLVARYVGEMAVVGEGADFQRLTQLILGETGLAVRNCLAPKTGSNDLVIWCGAPPEGLTVDLLLYCESIGCRERPEFSWTLGGAPPEIGREMASYAAGEAFLLAMNGWKRRHLQFGLISVMWVETIRKLAKDMGFSLRGEELDTP